VSARPRGRYLAGDVGRLAGVSGERIGQWARWGYIRSSQSAGRPRVYSFQDVAEAMVVHELLVRGVPRLSIRAAVEQLRGRYGDWPLSGAPIATSGSEIVVGDDTVARSLLPGLEELSLVRDQLRRGGWAVRLLPDLGQIEVDPDRLSGRPTIRSTRIPAEDVARLARSAGGPEALRREYGLSDAQIADAVRWSEAVEHVA
jgi:uncharacterized protein (DUF433 family)/DNA-binding transcriptional MerR regulator